MQKVEITDLTQPDHRNVEIFQCRICLGFSQRAVETNCCKNIYCKDCLLRWAKVSKTCPFKCPGQLKEHKAPKQYLEFYGQLGVSCPDCRAETSPRQYPEHRKVCPALENLELFHLSFTQDDGTQGKFQPHVQSSIVDKMIHGKMRSLIMSFNNFMYLLVFEGGELQQINLSSKKKRKVNVARKEVRVRRSRYGLFDLEGLLAYEFGQQQSLLIQGHFDRRQIEFDLQVHNLQVKIVGNCLSDLRLGEIRE